MRALGMMAITFLIVRFGTLTVASYGAGSNLIQLILIPALGLSMAIATLVGQNIGAGNVDRAAEISKLGAYLGFGLLTGLGIIAFIFAPYLIAFFVPNDQAVIEGGTELLRITCLSWGFLGIQLCLTGVFRAVGNTKLPMILTLVSQWVIQFPLAFILSHNTSLGKIGIWWAFPIASVVTALITIVIYAKGDWKKERLTGKTNKLIDKVESEIVKEGFDISK